MSYITNFSAVMERNIVTPKVHLANEGPKEGKKLGLCPKNVSFLFTRHEDYFLKHMQRGICIMRMWLKSSRPMKENDAPVLHSCKSSIFIDWVYKPAYRDIGEF